MGKQVYECILHRQKSYSHQPLLTRCQRYPNVVSHLYCQCIYIYDKFFLNFETGQNYFISVLFRFQNIEFPFQKNYYNCEPLVFSCNSISIYIYMCVYIYIYIYICVCVCVCVCGEFNKFPDFFVYRH